MRALTWHGTHDVRVETVPDPEIVNPRDAIIEVTSTAMRVCGGAAYRKRRARRRQQASCADERWQSVHLRKARRTWRRT